MSSSGLGNDQVMVLASAFLKLPTECDHMHDQKLPATPGVADRVDEVTGALLSPECHPQPLGSPFAAVASGSASSSATDLWQRPSRSVTPESNLPQHALAAPFSRRRSLSPEHSIGSPSLKAPCTSSKEGGCPTATWRRVQSFIQASTSSSLIASALAAVDVLGHPSVGQQGAAYATAGALRWTLSAMLTLFLRSGAAVPTEESLLAILWTLESWSDARRSPATVVLGDYVKHLAAFDTVRAEAMGVNWRETFCALRAAVVEAQVELLNGLEWNARISDGAIMQSYRLLFGSLPSSGPDGTAAAHEAEACAAAAAAAVGSARRGWKDPAGACAPKVNLFCSKISMQSSRIAAAAAKMAAAAATAAVARAKRPATTLFTSHQNCPSPHPFAKRPKMVAHRIMRGSSASSDTSEAFVF